MKLQIRYKLYIEGPRANRTSSQIPHGINPQPNRRAPRGRAGRPSHRVENRAWCTDRTQMAKINNKNRKADLAMALASGGTVTAWAAANPAVKKRTAYSWSRSREVLDQVEAIRRAALEQAIGRLSTNATDSAEEIARLAKEAASESVRLQAARAVLAELMTVSNYAALERRLAEIERRLQDRSPFPAPGSEQDPTSRSVLATGDWPPGEEGESCPTC
jgi:hypothetical protein